MAEVAAEEHLALLLAEAQRAEHVAHAELGDHLPGDLGGAVDVVLRAGGGLAEDELLGRAAAEQHRQLVAQLARGVRGTCPRWAATSVQPSARPRAMIETLCTGRVSGSTWPTSAWPPSW